jgi:anthranilate synthase component 2
MGVCLGHQAIAEVFGGQLINLTQVYHGIASSITLKEKEGLFQGLDDRIQVGRYHSWVVDPNSISELEITAVDDLDYVMAFRHKTLNIVGVQFHPESVLTPMGKKMLSNWLSL